MIGFLINAIWQEVKELQRANTIMVERVHETERLIAGKYVTKEELMLHINALFTKLDKIEDKLDSIK